MNLQGREALLSHTIGARNKSKVIEQFKLWVRSPLEAYRIERRTTGFVAVVHRVVLKNEFRVLFCCCCCCCCLPDLRVRERALTKVPLRTRQSRQSSDRNRSINNDYHGLDNLLFCGYVGRAMIFGILRAKCFDRPRQQSQILPFGK